MNTYKYKCGHEIESEEVMHDTESVLCSKCESRLQKLKQKHIDSDIVTMSYFNYKRKYSTLPDNICSICLSTSVVWKGLVMT